MESLKERRCVPCEGGVRPHDAKSAAGMMTLLHPDWRLAEEGRLVMTKVVGGFIAAK